MHLKSLVPLLLLAITPSVTLAQSHTPPGAGTAVTPPAAASLYHSAFADYKPYKEPVVTSWREANDQVRDTGGMQGHDMDAMQSKADDPHAGHDMTKMAPAKVESKPKKDKQ